MKKLVTSDIFKFGRCLKAIGAKDVLKDVALKATEEENVASIGYDLLYQLLENASENNAETAIYEFLSGPFEMDPEQVAELPIEELIKNLKAVASKETWLAFFKSAVPKN